MQPLHKPTAPLNAADQATQEVILTPGSSPDFSYGGVIGSTVAVPLITGRFALLKRFALPLICIALIVAFLSGSAAGYLVGKDRAVKASANHVGWLMTSATIGGVATPFTSETIFLYWNIAQTPSNPTADWYILNPVNTKHPLLADVKVDAISNGQGVITIISHSAVGDVTVTGTLTGNILTLVVPPNNRLFPAAPNAFVTLTFTASTTDAFNQLVAEGA